MNPSKVGNSVDFIVKRSFNEHQYKPYLTGFRTLSLLGLIYPFLIRYPKWSKIRKMGTYGVTNYILWSLSDYSKLWIDYCSVFNGNQLSQDLLKGGIEYYSIKEQNCKEAERRLSNPDWKTVHKLFIDEKDDMMAAITLVPKNSNQTPEQDQILKQEQLLKQDNSNETLKDLILSDEVKDQLKNNPFNGVLLLNSHLISTIKYLRMIHQSYKILIENGSDYEIRKEFLKYIQEINKN